MFHMTKQVALLNPSAQQLWDSKLSPNVRVLITGGSGWFGQTAACLMKSMGFPTLLLASQSRTISTLGNQFEVSKFDTKKIATFSPTVIIDCAFITRERINEYGLSNYIKQNEILIQQLVDLISLQTVDRFISFSSGAAVHPKDAALEAIDANPYGYLKRTTEIKLEALSRTLGKPGVIARAWSVSGGLVSKPKSFAFSDFISQAVQGEIKIRAGKPVFRRYSSVEDLLALSLAEIPNSGTTVLNSEGELVELGELARKIVQIINPDALITRERPTNASADNYFSETNLWGTLQTKHLFSPYSLESQIRSTHLGMKMRGDI